MAQQANSTMAAYQRKFKNPVIIQFMRLDISAVFSTCQNTEEAGSTVNERMDSSAGTREEHAGKEQVLPSSFHIHHKGYHQKV